ncbi:MAG: serine/threonine-protein kinase [Bradymonadaceae bacterium]
MISPPKIPKHLDLPAVGETIEGRYKLLEAMSSGGMGVVMRAEHIMMEREVAVKLLHAHIASQPGFTERFKREVRVATLFGHPNITRVYDFGETSEGTLYLVMELLEGVELKDIIKRDGALIVSRVFEIGLQILEGLAEAHSQNVIHRDLKPSNIFIVPDRHGSEQVKLLDFGIARLTDSAEMTLTGTGLITGTPSYMAPEVLLGESPGKGVDVYAAGLILLEMLMSQRVFDGATIAQNLLMQLKKPVPIPAVIDRTPLGAVLRKATCKHPDDRYADADQMLKALKAARAGSPMELRLNARQIPAPMDKTSSSLLVKIARPDNDLEILRQVPQHKAVHTSPPTRTVTELLGSDDIEILDEFDEKTSRYNPETALIRPNSTSTTTALIEPESGHASEPVFKIKGRGGVLPWAAGGLFIVVLIGMVLFLWPGTPVEDETESQKAVAHLPAAPTPATPEPLEPERLKLSVRSIPQGAQVFIDDQTRGTTDLTLELHEEELPFTLRLEHVGFEPETLELDALPKEPLVFSLNEVPETAPRPTRARAPARPVKERPPPSEPPPKKAAPTPKDPVDSVLDRYLPEL